MDQLSEYELKSLNKLGASIQDGKWSNDGLVQLIELVGGDFLNLRTIPNYSKQTGLTYNGVKKTRVIREILTIKFVINND